MKGGAAEETWRLVGDGDVNDENHDNNDEKLDCCATDFFAAAAAAVRVNSPFDTDR